MCLTNQQDTTHLRTMAMEIPNLKNFTNGLIPNPHCLSSYLNIITRAAVNSSG